MAAVMAITVAASSCGSAECERILVRWREEWVIVKERVKSLQALLSISTIARKCAWKLQSQILQRCGVAFLVPLDTDGVCVKGYRRTF